MREKIAVAALVAILLLVNWSIAGKERHLAEGAVVFLELAPVDPRSLMQGDYMALRFQLANDLYQSLPKREERVAWRRAVDSADGHVVVKLDENGIGSFDRIDNGEALKENEIRMRFRVRAGEVKLATNAWFFQEGHAAVYEPARYGQFRVDDGGELLLAGMYDENLVRLEPGE